MEWVIRLQSQVMQGLEYQTGEAKWSNGPHTWLYLRITRATGQDTDSGASTE